VRSLCVVGPNSPPLWVRAVSGDALRHTERDVGLVLAVICQDVYVSSFCWQVSCSAGRCPAVRLRVSPSRGSAGCYTDDMRCFDVMCCAVVRAAVQHRVVLYQVTGEEGAEYPLIRVMVYHVCFTHAAWFRPAWVWGCAFSTLAPPCCVPAPCVCCLFCAALALQCRGRLVRLLQLHACPVLACRCTACTSCKAASRCCSGHAFCPVWESGGRAGPRLSG
jgi:hypothetical protein